jgi:hypothetical protein
MTDNAWLTSIDHSTEQLAVTRDGASQPRRRVLASVAYTVMSLRIASDNFSATATTVQ